MNTIYFSKTTYDTTTPPMEAKKRQSEYCRQIVADAAQRELGLKPCDICFLTDTNGKPYLNNAPSFHFNISHTKKAVVVTVSDKQVGVDIELLKMANMKVARKLFLPQEVEYISELPKETDKRFYEIWTRKEAYAKYLGTGIFREGLLKQIDVLEPRADERLFTLFIGEYVVSVCGGYGCGDFRVVDTVSCQMYR